MTMPGRDLVWAWTLAILVWALHVSQGSEADAPVVMTSHGRVRGVNTGVAKVFTVPYAAPPIGPLRWRPPQRPKSWHPNVMDALEVTGCPQVVCANHTQPLACPKKISEDCLQLTVFTPPNAKNGSNLAVMVFFHGGDFVFMSGTSPLFDGAMLAQQDVIQVNINYRLGALGFLVTGKEGNAAQGNYGLLDQRLALTWVKENIRQFGGNPDQVTLFGQGSGAQSVLHHLVSKESSDLFHRAVAESAPLSLPYKTFSEAFILGGFLAEQLNCTVADMACLRSRSADQVALAAFLIRSKVVSFKLLELFEPFGPYVDLKEVKGQHLTMFATGQFTRKPVILGTTTEETVLQIYKAFPNAVNISEYVDVITAWRPSEMFKVVETYPPSGTDTDQREILVKMTTDLLFSCSTRNLSATLLVKGQNDLWLYEWDHALSFPGWGDLKYCNGRVCHGSELVYVFGTAYKGNFTFTGNETLLSQDTIAYWTNFAKTGDPNNHTMHRSIMKGEPCLPSDVLHKHGSTMARLRVSSDSEIRSPGKAGPKVSSRSLSEEQSGNELPTEFAPLTWPRYGQSGARSLLRFQAPSRSLVQNYRKEFCDFWDTIGYQ